MSKNFIAIWPELGISVECMPNEDGSNKWIYDWYVDHMPIHYVQLHAMCTGAVMYTWCRVSEDLPKKGDNVVINTQISKAALGTGHMSYNIPNGLAAGRNGHIAFNYGEAYEDMPGYFAFKVVERDLDKLIKVGEEVARAIYKTKKVITCKLTVKQD
ncbi:MAG: hypothetical protein AB2L21_05355 [Anaerolineaceae bacterium]